MEKFWQQKYWLEKTKENNEEFYNSVVNGKNIDIDWNTFSLIIDGIAHELKLGDGDQKIIIVNEDGCETVFER